MGWRINTSTQAPSLEGYHAMPLTFLISASSVEQTTSESLGSATLFSVRLSIISSAPTLLMSRPLNLRVAVDVETSHATLPWRVYDTTRLLMRTPFANSMSAG